MNDGHRFSTPALIEPGWILSVPVDVMPEADTIPDLLVFQDDHVVVAGDSYWRIAETHLDPFASPPEIAAYTEVLMDLNAPLLGYADRRLIRPGDIVQLVATESPTADEAPIVTAPAPPIAVGFPPPVVVPSSTAVPDLAPPLAPPAATPDPSPADSPTYRPASGRIVLRERIERHPVAARSPGGAPALGRCDRRARCSSTPAAAIGTNRRAPAATDPAGGRHRATPPLAEPCRATGAGRSGSALCSARPGASAGSRPCHRDRRRRRDPRVLRPSGADRCPTLAVRCRGRYVATASERSSRRPG